MTVRSAEFVLYTKKDNPDVLESMNYKPSIVATCVLNGRFVAFDVKEYCPKFWSTKKEYSVESPLMKVKTGCGSATYGLKTMEEAIELGRTFIKACFPEVEQPKSTEADVEASRGQLTQTAAVGSLPQTKLQTQPLGDDHGRPHS